MKVNEYLKAQCWCARTEMEIPVAWLLEGQTGSCGPGCGPGCQMVESDSDDPYDKPPREKKVWKMHKFSPARYDPIDDSTDGLPWRADAVSLLVGVGLCACGCGDAPAGRKAKFCMGHDARLKGKLTRAHSAGVAVALVEETTGVATVVSALEYADRFSTPKVDWRELVTVGASKIAQRRGKIDRRAAERAVLERATRDGAVRVGRWDKTGSAAAIYQLPDGRYKVEYVDEVGRVAEQIVEVA